ncbi:MAG: MFS transporter [Acidobacteriota bacterium]
MSGPRNGARDTAPEAPPPGGPAPAGGALKHRPPFWVFTLYFSEGFPYSMVHQFSTVFFKDHGASLEAVGLTSLYRLPWILKFAWAPLADAFSTKRRWILAAQCLLLGAALAMAAGSALPRPLEAVAALFLAAALLAATQDIAVDGFYLEALDRTRQAAYVGYQSMSYRLAMIAGGGGVIWFSGKFGWGPAFLLASGIIAFVFLFHAAFLPRTEPPKRPGAELLSYLFRPARLGILAAAAAGLAVLVWLWDRWGREVLSPHLPNLSVPAWIALAFLAAMVLLLVFLRPLKRRMEGSDSLYARAFVDYLDQRRIGVILAFLCTYRTGESFLLAMVYPLLKDIGLARDQYGLIYGTFGVAASITGGILGGHLIGKFGLKKVIWPFVLAQNVPNLLYAALAVWYGPLAGHPERGAADPLVVAPFVVLEAFGAGLGTAVFMVFIMRTCKASFKSAHMSIATSIMNVSTTLAGVLSGFLAHWLGWPLFFVLTFLATVPSMAMIPFLPHLGREAASERP